MSGLGFSVVSGVLLRLLPVLGFMCLFSAVRADAPVYFTSDGAAIEGYDVVSYFTADAPQPGDPVHAVIWKGALWKFASAENREQFEANPRAYAPQYGGYCAYGVAQGVAVRTDPTLFSIEDGRLYLIHSKAVWQRWVQDVPGHIDRADANWPAVLGRD